MFKKVEVKEVEGEGLIGLLEQRVLVFCLNYIYTGKLKGVNTTCILLEDAAIVYETGPLGDKSFKDAQKLPHPLYIQVGAIESFGLTSAK